MRIIEDIDIGKIKMRGTTPFDPRVLEYANKVKSGTVFPPIKIKNIENGLFRVKDGRHRLVAHKLAGKDRIRCAYFKTKEK